MSKKDKNAPLDGQTPQEQPGEVTEEYRQEDAGETFTVTREQMEKMEKLAGEIHACVLEGLVDVLRADEDLHRRSLVQHRQAVGLVGEQAHHLIGPAQVLELRLAEDLGLSGGVDLATGSPSRPANCPPWPICSTPTSPASAPKRWDRS